MSSTLALSRLGPTRFPEPGQIADLTLITEASGSWPFVLEVDSLILMGTLGVLANHSTSHSKFRLSVGLEPGRTPWAHW